MNEPPILSIDDDTDDRDLLQDAWRELNFLNPLIFFSTGNEVLQYLRAEKVGPFLILCDVNIPKMDGFALKAKLLEDPKLNYKSIPFVFWSAQASPAQIQKAYDLGGNGFFIKDNNFKDLERSLIDIVNYWLKRKTPL